MTIEDDDELREILTSSKTRFDDAIAVVSYLERLGITDAYTSPYFAAQRGSTNGYDVCDHSQINPEIGKESELEELVAALHRHDMGLVLDIVPNHMGICGRHNAWWWDVLKNGRHSHFAEYFDIDWESPDARLRGKVLVPILGDYYGRRLERSESKLVHEAGEILLAYHENRFPIAPDTLTLSREFASDTLTTLNADLTALDSVIQGTSPSPVHIFSWSGN